MKRRLLVLLLLIFAIGSSVQAQQRNPVAPGGASRSLGGGGTPIADLRDPGFELAYGNPLRSDAWESESLVFGTPICDATCGIGVYSGPASGSSFWVWFGGTSSSTTDFVQQQVVIPSNGTMGLIYDVWVGFSASTWSMTVSLDSVVVDTLPTGVTVGYVSRYVDITAYADGQVHTVRFDFTKDGTGGAVINIDNVALSKGNPIFIGDAGFELNDGSWTVINGTTDKRKCNTLTKTYSFTGTCAFVFKGGAGESSTLKQAFNILRSVPPDPRRAPPTYGVYLGGFVKSNASATGRLMLKLSMSDATKLKSKISLVGTGAYAWKQTPFKLYAGDLSITRVKIIVLNTSLGGKILVDDLEVNVIGVY